ncbi:MAG: hypothetical protein JXB23_08490 [Candidatus Aminicenantes bacterium]|nr:hypothetical protein [Candidatus Aminicenantes bacterium]
MKAGYLAAVLSVAALCSSFELKAQSVEFLRTIDFAKGSKDRGIASLIFGAKQDKGMKPGALCRIDRDRFAITDAVNGAMFIVGNDGKIQKRISHAGKIKLISPVAVCRNDESHLFVADSARGVVFEYDADYKFLEVFLTPENSRITGLVFSRGEFFCIDTPNHRILCFGKDGALIKSFGCRGSGDGEFNFPTHIAADDEYIYVTDALNFRVQIFDFGGDFIRTFGNTGRGGGNFSKPKGIAVDKNKRVFVADAEFDNVQIFNFKGEFLYHLGGPGHMDGEFWLPSGVMVDADGSIWVADTYNTRIQIFRIVE